MNIAEERTQSTPKTKTKATPLNARQRYALITASLLLSDTLALGTAFLAAYLLRFQVLPYTAEFDANSYLRLAFIALPIWLGLFAIFQLYNQHLLFGGLKEYSHAFNAISIGAVLLTTIGFFMRDTNLLSRGWLLLTWALALVMVIGLRFTIRRMIYALRTRGHLLVSTLVVGANDEGRALAEQLRDWKTSGLNIKGFVDNELETGSIVENSYRVLGCLDDLENLVKNHHAEEIIIAPTALSRNQLLDIFQNFNPRPDITLRMSSGLFEILTTGMRVKELAYVPLIEVNTARIDGVDAVLKWIMDYGITVPGLILLSPLLLILAVLVRLDSPGPIIYRRRVMGMNGKEFDAFKFRTMHINGDEILAAHPELHAELAENFKLKADPRITRVGIFLRKFSLDELPQLFNVLAGQMSLIGPRMISPPEMEKYSKWGMNLLTVKPGITGLWQVSGRSDTSYEERVRFDMYYIRNWTIWLDVYILVMTPIAVLHRKGAY